jgi:hypothetical protein
MDVRMVGGVTQDAAGVFEEISDKIQFNVNDSSNPAVLFVDKHNHAVIKVTAPAGFRLIYKECTANIDPVDVNTNGNYQKRSILDLVSMSGFMPGDHEGTGQFLLSTASSVDGTLNARFTVRYLAVQ